MHARTLLVSLALIGGAAGCGSRAGHVPTESSLRSEHVEQVDMSGHWELDYALSDSLEHKVHMRFLEEQYRMRDANSGQRASPAGSGARSGLRSFARIGYFTDEITQIPEIEVVQDDEGIHVRREGDYSLVCRYRGGFARPTKESLGAELCGWSGSEMVFVAAMSDGLTVTHRLSLAADRQKLNVATTVRSRGVREPFTLNRVYSRFSPLPSEFECETTLERGRSCRRKSG